jgi:predicted methyltransferase MtxX (methanogen marker protein 4)
MGILSNFSVKQFQSNMFRVGPHLDVLTVFHKPSLPASVRVVNLLKTASANSQETATEDQAADHSAQNNAVAREPFELEVTEADPTPDQVKSILDYLGNGKAATLVKGASSTSDALRKLKESGDAFQRPVVVDWNQGRAVVGDNESEILKLVKELPKKS